LTDYLAEQYDVVGTGRTFILISHLWNIKATHNELLKNPQIFTYSPLLEIDIRLSRTTWGYVNSQKKEIGGKKGME